MPKFRVSVEKEKCIGCGSCEAVCPGNFKVENGKAKVLNKVVKDSKCSQTAAESCPTEAIKVEAIKD